MDVTYHLAMGILVSKVTTNTFDNGLIIFSSVVPDLVGCAPFYYFKIKKELKEKKGFKKIIRNIANGNLENRLEKATYYLTHSILGIFLYFLMTILFFSKFALFALIAYTSHILIDIPTHNKDWAFRPFYPISNRIIEGRNWWKNKRINIIMWGTLLILALITLFF